MMAILMVMTITARSAMPLGSSKNAMSYKEAKKEALYLSDKMAYELSLNDAQYDAVYEINLDYMMSVSGRNDVYGAWWSRRNTDLQFILTAYQYKKYVEISYFYRPLTWKNGSWTFNVYTHYGNKSHFYKAHPKGYLSYKGGNNKKAPNHYASMKPKVNNSHVNGTTRKITNKTTTTKTTTKTTVSKPAAHRNNQVAQNTNSKGHFGRK